MNPVSIQAQIVALAITAVLVFSAGFGLERVLKEAEIAKLNSTHEKQLGEAKDNLIAANKRADEAEEVKRTKLADAAAQYEATRQKDRDHDDKIIADLRGAVVRLRVSTAPDRGQVPGPAACACAGDGQAEQTLAPAVAARLAERYADYNELVDQLSLCQAVVILDRTPSAPSAK